MLLPDMIHLRYYSVRKRSSVAKLKLSHDEVVFWWRRVSDISTERSRLRHNAGQFQHYLDCAFFGTWDTSSESTSL